jgi:beta-phosphoglucomutase family hydrolase
MDFWSQAPMKRAFLFDMDGTIVDNMAYHTASWVQFFERRGRTIDGADFFRRTAGRHSREILRDWLRHDLSDAECEACSLEKDEIYRALYAPHLRTIAGFARFIARAQVNGVALAVGTAGPEGNIRFTLDGLGLRGHFDAVVGAADVRRGKPAPDVFELAAKRCGARAEDCIVFEDAPLGVEAARRAGMRCVVLTTTLGAEAFDVYDNVIASVRDYEELEALWKAAGPF